MKFLNNRKPRVTLVEAIGAMLLCTLIVGVVMANVVTTTATDTVREYDSDIDFRSKNFHTLMRRDVLLASSMVPFDEEEAVEVIGDTLVIRFSNLDSVRYFLDQPLGSIYREDIPVIDNVLGFDITYDTITVNVTITVAAESLHRWVNNGELYNRQYAWVTVLNNSQVRE